MRHFLDITDLSIDDLVEVLTLSEAPIPTLGRPLAGAGVALIFEKPSNRTRQSTEMAVVSSVVIRSTHVATRSVSTSAGRSRTSPASCPATTPSSRRVFDHGVVARLAASASVPVLNMLSDRSHPLQGLADTLTMQQTIGALRDRTVAYVGDYNNVARSLAEASVMLGAHVRLGCPAGYDAGDDELARIDALGPGTVEQVADPSAAVRGAAVVHTDTWTSMGQEAEKAERTEIFGRYQVNDALMSSAGDADGEAWFMHCLPAYRGLEVTDSVIEGSRSMVWRQGHNRMHTARGVLAFLTGVRP
ncbi:MAG: ornithine carbamoyltransferase [Ilumatobacteraceae bacterium]